MINLLLLAYIDKNISDNVKEYIERLPKNAFSEVHEKELFLKLKSGIDVFSACDELEIEVSKVLEDLDSEEYKIFSKLDKEAQIDLAKSVMEEYRKSQISFYTRDFELSILSDKSTPSKALGMLSNRIARLPSFSGDTSVKTIAGEFAKELSDRMEAKSSPLIPIHYPRMSEMFRGGFRRKDMVLISAPTEGYKTTFAMNLMRGWAKMKQFKILYITTEMSQEKTMERWVCQEAYDRGCTVTSDMLSKPKDMDEFRLAVDILNDIGNYDVTFAFCKTELDEMEFEMRKDCYDIVIVDHIHDMNDTEDAHQVLKALDVFRRYAEASNSLVVLLGQYAKAEAYGSKKSSKPHLGMIYGSSKLINKMSQILALYKTEEDPENLIHVMCLKDRDSGQKNNERLFEVINFSNYFKEIG